MFSVNSMFYEIPFIGSKSSLNEFCLEKMQIRVSIIEKEILNSISSISKLNYIIFLKLKFLSFLNISEEYNVSVS